MTSRLEDAVDEAAESLSIDLAGRRPDLVIAFVSADYESHYSRLAPSIAALYPSATLLGCSAGGVIGGGREVEREPAVALMGAVLPDVELHPFALGRDPRKWREQIGVDPADEPSFLLLPDPFTTETEPLLSCFDGEYPGCTVIGGLASGAISPGGNALFAGTEVTHAGAVGLALTGNIAIETVVAQGCRPIGTPLFVTRRERNIILELDGEPALGMLEKIHESLSPAEKKLVRHSLFVGVVMDESRQAYEQGDFLIRNLMGIDPESGAIAVATPLRDNQVVQFHLRDAETSADDVDEMLAKSSSTGTAGALLFSCLGRGAMLYGHTNHDSDAFRRNVGDLPIGGFFCNGEIGPVGGRTFVHGYTSSFGLIRPRR
jgi:small ligand-binding sensory domain FIST